MSKQVYSIITERICNLLKESHILWQHPWTTPGIFPQNMISRRLWKVYLWRPMKSV